MPQYRYQARNGTGNVEDGALAASDAATAAAMLRGKGLHVLQLAPATTGAGLGNLSAALNWSSGPSKKDILDFKLTSSRNVLLQPFHSDDMDMSGDGTRLVIGMPPVVVVCDLVNSQWTFGVRLGSWSAPVGAIAGRGFRRPRKG